MQKRYCSPKCALGVMCWECPAVRSSSISSKFQKAQFFKLEKSCWSVLWLFGLVYTGKNIANAAFRYSRYPTQIYEKQGDITLTFPKVIVCSNSMHSSQGFLRKLSIFEWNWNLDQRSRIFERFGHKDHDLVTQFLYAQNVSRLPAAEEQLIEALDRRPLREFFKETSPKYWVIHCRFNKLVAFCLVQKRYF